MTSWKDKIGARLAARAARSAPTAGEERAAGGKVPVAGPPRERKARKVSPATQARILTLAASAGAFADVLADYRKEFATRDRKAPKGVQKVRKKWRLWRLWHGVRTAAEALLGEPLDPSIEIAWSSARDRPRFVRPKKHPVIHRGTLSSRPLGVEP